VVIDCGWCRLVFLEADGVKLISTQEVMKELREGATFFMMIAQSEKKSSEEQIHSICVVDNLHMYFLTNFLGYPQVWMWISLSISSLERVWCHLLRIEWHR